MNFRPFAHDILRELSKEFEIMVFTASVSCYADAVLDLLDPENEFISYRLYRQHCVATDDGNYIKDLRVIGGGRHLQNMVLVDNSALSYGYQIDNGIPIVPFYHNYNDNELKNLAEYIKLLADVPDVREVNKKAFKMQIFQKFGDPKLLVQTLFRK